jgi:ligand-binding sensor domain-containing protein
MKMFAAIFFVCGCFLFPSLVCSQQYPFITYTIKDGLISNRVRKMYQDSSGRLFFLTHGGLSIYDGARFTNYSTEDGLRNELINDVMQMDKDSFWIATNAPEINCLVRGKISKIKTADGFCPVVNQLYRNKQGLLFAAADQGLFVFESNRFKHLQFISDGKDVGSFLHRIEAINDELMLVEVDAGRLNEHATLFLYNYKLQKIISSARAGDFGTKSADLYWVMTESGLRLIDVNELNKISFS